MRDNLWLEIHSHCRLTDQSFTITVSFVFFLDPVILPRQQVDKGAIKFLLSGANVMCRGLTSPGAKLADLPKGAIVVSSSYVI